MGWASNELSRWRRFSFRIRSACKLAAAHSDPGASPDLGSRGSREHPSGRRLGRIAPTRGVIRRRCGRPQAVHRPRLPHGGHPGEAQVAPRRYVFRLCRNGLAHVPSVSGQRKETSAEIGTQPRASQVVQCQNAVDTRRPLVTNRPHANDRDPRSIFYAASSRDLDPFSLQRRFMQRPVGYDYTICGGEIVLEQDDLTGALPGRLVRRPPRTSQHSTLAARGETPAAFEQRSIPAGCVAPRSHMHGYARSSRLASRAPRRSRCYAGFHHGLLADQFFQNHCSAASPTTTE